MKLAIPCKGFLEALNLASPVVKSRTPKEILRHVKLRATKDCVTLIASDSEVWLQARIDCEVHRPGECMLPHDQVKRWVSELREDAVELSETDGIATLSTGSGECTIPTANAAEFPVPPEVEGDGIKVPGPDLARMLRRTVCCVDETSVKYPLGGVCFDFQDKKLVLAATDSKRLTVCKTDIAATGADFVLPKKACEMLQAAAGDGEVSLTIGSGICRFECADTTILSRKLEGRFPRWRDVVPKTCEAEIRLPVDSLVAAVRQAMVFTSTETIAVDLVIDAGKVTFSASGSGKGVSSFPVDTDAKIYVILNPRYILDAVRDVPPGFVATMRYINGDSAILLDVGMATSCIFMPLDRGR